MEPREIERLCQNLEIIHRVITSFCRTYASWQRRKGLVFSLANNDGVLLFEPRVVGVIPQEKASRYESACTEKALRLGEHGTDVSSFQSRDAAIGRWGGAVRIQNEVFAASGYNEHGDEAAMLLLAEKRFTRTSEAQAVFHQCSRIAQVSGNLLWEPIRPQVIGLLH